MYPNSPHMSLASTSVPTHIFCAAIEWSLLMGERERAREKKGKKQGNIVLDRARENMEGKKKRLPQKMFFFWT